MATRGRYLFLLDPPPQPWLNSPALSPSSLCSGCLLLYLQALRLLRLANELEGKVVALKKEALQHITIALAGSDTSGLFQLLTMFFGTGEADEDPFNFLDGAPLIKQPLPLTSESSDDEEVPASQPTTSRPSASTSASRVPRVKKQTFEDLCDLNEAIIMLPMEKSLHETGIPDDMLPARDKVYRTTKGGSLYFCKHPRCVDRPYSGDLPGYGSHFHRVHLGICLGCPYCPDRHYWNSIGWLKHMKEKHTEAPWYGSQIIDEHAQAEAMLAALQKDPTAHIVESAQQRVDASLAALDEPEALPEEECEDDEGKPFRRPPTPTRAEFRAAMMLAPSDLRQYYYAFGPNANIRYKKDDSTTMMVACSIVSADIPPEEEGAKEEDDPLEPPDAKKSKLES